MAAPHFRLQKRVTPDQIRPGDHLYEFDDLGNGTPMLVDGVNITRDVIEVAVFPPHRTTGRRVIVKFRDGDEAFILPSLYATPVIELIHRAGGDIGLRSGRIALGDWELVIDGEQIVDPSASPRWTPDEDDTVPPRLGDVAPQLL